MTNNNGDEFDREYIEELLPWYATGKLGSSEKIEVDNALKSYPELRAQLGLVAAEMIDTIKLNEATATPRPGASERFMRLVQRDMERSGHTKRLRFKEFLEWLALQFAAPPRWAIAAALLAIVVQASLIGMLLIDRGSGRFHTAGGTDQRAEGTLVLARFSDNLTLEVLSERLSALGIIIVDGPKAGGLFTLRIGLDNMPVGERDKKIAALKANADFVVFVGLVQ